MQLHINLKTVESSGLTTQELWSKRQVAGCPSAFPTALPCERAPRTGSICRVITSSPSSGRAGGRGPAQVSVPPRSRGPRIQRSRSRRRRPSTAASKPPRSSAALADMLLSSVAAPRIQRAGACGRGWAERKPSHLLRVRQVGLRYTSDLCSKSFSNANPFEKKTEAKTVSLSVLLGQKESSSNSQSGAFHLWDPTKSHNICFAVVVFHPWPFRGPSHTATYFFNMFFPVSRKSRDVLCNPQPRSLSDTTPTVSTPSCFSSPQCCSPQ